MMVNALVMIGIFIFLFIVAYVEGKYTRRK